MNIIVRQDGDKWGAFYGDKRIAHAKCRSCIVNVVLSVTKKSMKYSRVTVMNEDGTIAAILMTGANQKSTT